MCVSIDRKYRAVYRDRMGIRSYPGLGKAVSPRKENDWPWARVSLWVEETSLN